MATVTRTEYIQLKDLPASKTGAIWTYSVKTGLYHAIEGFEKGRCPREMREYPDYFEPKFEGCWDCTPIPYAWHRSAVKIMTDPERYKKFLCERRFKLRSIHKYVDAIRPGIIKDDYKKNFCDNQTAQNICIALESIMRYLDEDLNVELKALNQTPV